MTHPAARHAGGLLVLLAANATIAASAAIAGDAPASTPEANIRAGFAQSFPDVHIDSVSATPWPGVYEAVTPEGIFYADATGRYAINGKLVDVQTRANLTQERQDALERIDFSSLPLGRAIRMIKGNGSRVMAVFADPDCPYCRKLETDLKQVDDVTVYTFLFPIDGLHPEASTHSRQIWCSADQARSWSAWVADRVAPENRRCDGDPIDELATLGQKLKIFGTPTIFLADGRRIPGYVPREQLEQALASVASVATARVPSAPAR